MYQATEIKRNQTMKGFLNHIKKFKLQSNKKNDNKICALETASQTEMKNKQEM